MWRSTIDSLQNSYTQPVRMPKYKGRMKVGDRIPGRTLRAVGECERGEEIEIWVVPPGLWGGRAGTNLTLGKDIECLNLDDSRELRLLLNTMADHFGWADDYHGRPKANILLELAEEFDAAEKDKNVPPAASDALKDVLAGLFDDE